MKAYLSCLCGLVLVLVMAPMSWAEGGTVVELEARVKDDSGAPVAGLSPEDFELRLEGRRVAVESFAEVRAGRLVDPGDSVLPPSLHGVLPGEVVARFAEPSAFVAPARLELDGGIEGTVASGSSYRLAVRVPPGAAVTELSLGARPAGLAVKVSLGGSWQRPTAAIAARIDP